MDYVGLANIFEKKECIVNGKIQIYYKKLEPCFGFVCHFNNDGKTFVILTGKLAGRTITSNSVYNWADFKNLNELCAENNNTYNYNKFMSMGKYRVSIGNYYTYDSNKRMFSLITSQELLQKNTRYN